MRAAVLGTLLSVSLPLVLPAQAPSGTSQSTGSPAAERLFEARKFDEARAAFQVRLANNPRDAQAMAYLGRIAQAQQKRSEAIGWLEKAVKQDDGNAMYHFWLGSALGDEARQASKLRQPFLARRVKSEFERAVALDSTLLQPRFGLVDFYTMAPGIMGGSVEKAREQATAIARLNPMQGHLAHARIAMREKNDSAAIREYEAAIAAAPDSTPAYYGLSTFYRDRSRWADAMNVMERLIKARPDDAVPHAVWGIISAISGIEMERGERELKHYLANAVPETTPQSFANVHFRLGQIYEKTGRRDAARGEYEKALTFNPELADARKALTALK